MNKSSSTAIIDSVDAFYDQYHKDKNLVVNTSKKLPQNLVIDRWRNDLERLEPYLKEWLPRLEGKTLHIVLQTHPLSPDDNKPIVLRSQANVSKELEKLKPKLLLVEASWIDRFTRENFIATTLKGIPDMAIALHHPSPPKDQLTAEKISPMIDKIIETNAMLKYAVAHPETYTAGAEWEGVHMLDEIWMSRRDIPGADNAFLAGRTIRTWNSAAVASELMEKRNLNEATIVMGKDHRGEYELLQKLFSVSIDFRQTL